MLHCKLTSRFIVCPVDNMSSFLEKYIVLIWVDITIELFFLTFRFFVTRITVNGNRDTTKNYVLLNFACQSMNTLEVPPVDCNKHGTRHKYFYRVLQQGPWFDSLCLSNQIFFQYTEGSGSILNQCYGRPQSSNDGLFILFF